MEARLTQLTLLTEWRQAPAGQASAAVVFRRALAAADVSVSAPATVLCDGDAGLWRLQREVLPGATPVLEAAKGFRRLKAHRQLPISRAALAARAVRHAGKPTLERQSAAA